MFFGVKRVLVTRSDMLEHTGLGSLKASIILSHRL